jgi:DNA-binding winged helix-turn-helix (wHTH) protein
MTEPAPVRDFRFAGFAIDSRRRVLEHEGRLLELPRKCSELLLALLAEPGRMWTKDELFGRVWPGVVVEENSLAQAVSTLRRALGDSATQPRFIETVARRGYRFIATLERVETLVAATTAADAGPALAVLPLRFSGDGADDWLADALGDALIARFARAGLRVRGSGAVRRYAGRDVDPGQAGRELGCTVVLDGELRRRGDALSLSVQLIRCDRGDVVYAERIGERVSDLVAIEERLAERVVAALVPTLAARGARQPTRDAQAYHLYLRGRHAANQMSASRYREACAAFAAALERDPGFALAYEGIAYAEVMASELWQPAAIAMPKARAHAERALALDPGLGRAHCTLATIALMYDRDRIAMQAALDEALRLEPEGASTLRVAAWLRALDGHAGEARELTRRAALIDDLDLEHHLHSAAIDWITRRYDAALERLAHIRRIDSDHWLALVLAGRCHEAEGRLDAALAAYQRATALAPDAVEAHGDLGRVLAYRGDRDGAKAVLARLDGGDFVCVPAFARAMVLLGLGELDACFAELERCLDERSWFATWFYTAPPLDPLREDARFLALRRRSGL